VGGGGGGGGLLGGGGWVGVGSTRWLEEGELILGPHQKGVVIKRRESRGGREVQKPSGRKNRSAEDEAHRGICSLFSVTDMKPISEPTDGLITRQSSRRGVEAEGIQSGKRVMNLRSTIDEGRTGGGVVTEKRR